MTDVFDPADMEARLSECVVLPEHHMAAGLLHIDGAGVRVATWDGTHLRHMSQAAARRLANDLEADETASALKPVIEAVRTLADRVDEINAAMATKH